MDQGALATILIAIIGVILSAASIAIGIIFRTSMKNIDLKIEGATELLGAQTKLLATQAEEDRILHKRITDTERALDKKIDNAPVKAEFDKSIRDVEAQLNEFKEKSNEKFEKVNERITGYMSDTKESIHQIELSMKDLSNQLDKKTIYDSRATKK